MTERKGANSLKHLLTQEVLLELAGDRYFATGKVAIAVATSAIWLWKAMG